MQVSPRYLVVPLLGVALISVGFLPDTASAQQTLTVNIGAGRDESGMTGTATLTDLGGGRTRVAARVSPVVYPNMPAHIHADPCPGVAAVVFPLTNFMNGESTTEVNASLSDIMARGKSINLHRSPQEIPVYVACGNLPAVAAAPAQMPAALPRTGEGEFGLYALAAVGALLITAGIGLSIRRRSM